MSVVDGVTGRTIQSNGTVTYKNGAVHLVNGSATLENLAVGDKLTISNVPGYRAERNTLFCGSTTFALWTNKPGDVDDTLTRAGYSGDGRLRRPDAVWLVPSPEIQANATAMSVERQAAQNVMDAVGGRIPIGVVTSVSEAGPGAVFNVFIDPAAAHDGNTDLRYSGDFKVIGIRIRYVNMGAALNLSLVMHEITRTLGVAGTSPYPGIMSASPNPNPLPPYYSDPEQRFLLLRFTRPLGAMFAGDNDQSIPCGSR